MMSNETKLNMLNRCWVCDCELSQPNKPEGNKTSHHAIPKCMKPKRNVEVPLCVKCHRKLEQILRSPNQYINKKGDLK